MFEKVNPCHPDKVADRIAGAIVDIAYTKSKNPKVAVEVLIGHGLATVMIETSEIITPRGVIDTVTRLVGEDMIVLPRIVKQDPHLAENQEGAIRCGDNGIFKGCPLTEEQKVLTAAAATIYGNIPYDGKYIIRNRKDGYGYNLTACQSHATNSDVAMTVAAFNGKNDCPIQGIIINPLGEWTGGPDVDCGATNRKLGSDMGDGVTGGGLHGKDLSKADVSVNIVCFLKAVASGQVVTAFCSIGDEQVTFTYADGHTETMPFEDIVEQARLYILTDCGGSFEKFAEWGLIRPNFPIE